MSPVQIAALNHALGGQGLTFEPKQAILHTTSNDAPVAVEAALNAVTQIRRKQKPKKK